MGSGVGNVWVKNIDIDSSSGGRGFGVVVAKAVIALVEVVVAVIAVVELMWCGVDSIWLGDNSSNIGIGGILKKVLIVVPMPLGNNAEDSEIYNCSKTRRRRRRQL